MSKTVDRQIVDGVIYEIMDASARESVAAEATVREEAVAAEATVREEAVAAEATAREAAVSDLKNTLNVVPLDIYQADNMLDIDITENEIKIDEFLKYTGYVYQTVDGYQKTATSDTAVMNTDFIPIKDIKSFSGIGSRSNDMATILFFSKPDASGYISALYGDSESRIGSFDWYLKTIDFATSDEIPESANFVILQSNNASVLIQTLGYVPTCNVMTAKSARLDNIGDELGIQTNEKTETNSIYKYLHYTGYILHANNGFNRAETTDRDIINSDFIPIEEFLEANVIGSPANDCITAAFFSDNNDESFITAFNGDTARHITGGWYQQYIYPNMVSGAKYVVLQANVNLTLTDASDPLYIKTNTKKVSFESDIVRKIYNVKDYGAVGGGFGDDTEAIQKAIDDCFNHGGGVVYIPEGTYALNTVSTRGGVTAHLFIPMTNALESRVTVRIEGDTSVIYPSFYIAFGGYAAHKPIFKGSTLKSTYIPNDSVTNEPIAVIASAPATNFTGCNFTRVQIEHLNIVTSVDVAENYPKVSGINASNIASVSIKDVTVGTDCKCTVLVGPPEGHVSYGIAMPKRLCDPNQLLEEVCVAGGFKYGVICTEHVHGINVQLQNCIYAFTFAQTDHPNYFSLCSVHGSKYQVAALGEGFGPYWYGNSGVKFELLDFEENVEQTPTDFNYEAGVYDPHNRLHGSLNYFMVKSGVGATNEDWTVVGAESLRITTENT